MRFQYFLCPDFRSSRPVRHMKTVPLWSIIFFEVFIKETNVTPIVCSWTNACAVNFAILAFSLLYLAKVASAHKTHTFMHFVLFSTMYRGAATKKKIIALGLDRSDLSGNVNVLNIYNIFHHFNGRRSSIKQF